VCERIAAGATLNQIASEPGMPSRSTINRWCTERPEFKRCSERFSAIDGEAVVCGDDGIASFDLRSRQRFRTGPVTPLL
jgi:hypothetical protein